MPLTHRIGQGQASTITGGKAMAGDITLSARRRGNFWRIAGWGAAAALILLPLVAMQFTSEVNWTASDFLFAAIMFGSVGLGLELAVRKGNRAYTFAATLALLVSLLSFWFTGAVGIIGNEAEDSNLLFLGVIAIALAGSLIALFRPAGMAVAMVVAAVAQALVPVAASIIGDSRLSAIWASEVIVLTIVFTGMWLASARLFRAAAQAVTRAQARRNSSGGPLVDRRRGSRHQRISED